MNFFKQSTYKGIWIKVSPEQMWLLYPVSALFAQQMPDSERLTHERENLGQQKLRATDVLSSRDKNGENRTPAPQEAGMLSGRTVHSRVLRNPPRYWSVLQWGCCESV